jgi:hypothetical protein
MPTNEKRGLFFEKAVANREERLPVAGEIPLDAQRLHLPKPRTQKHKSSFDTAVHTIHGFILQAPSLTARSSSALRASLQFARCVLGFQLWLICSAIVGGS